VKRLRSVVWCVVLSTALVACQSPPPAASGPWSEGWQALRLPGKAETAYRVVRNDGRWALHAQSQRSASLYRRTLHVPSARLERVSFSWKVAALVPGADVRTIDGEDAPVRVLFAFDGDSRRLSERNRMNADLMHALTGERPPFATLMYVWDNQAMIDSVVIGRRSDRVRKIVIESGPAALGQWRHYQRDLVADYRRAFGEDPGALTGVAVMTDTDNTRSQAEAWYGEIRIDTR
jgi:hypothetical protein